MSFFRWEKFAPGPVRVIAADALTAAQRVSVQAVQERFREKKKRAATAAADNAHPAPVALPPDVPAAEAPARPLGCTKCRMSPDGCRQCKNPNYRPRGKGGQKGADGSGKGTAKGGKGVAKGGKGAAKGGKGANGRGRGRGRKM